MLVWLPVLIYNLELRMGTGHGHGFLGHGNRMPTAHLAPNASKSSRKQSRLYPQVGFIALQFAGSLADSLPGWLLLCSHISIHYQGRCFSFFRCFLCFTCFFPFLSFPFISLFFGWNIFNALDILGTEQYFLMHLQFFR